MKQVPTLISKVLAIALLTSNVNASEMTLICNTEIVSATFKADGDLAATHTQSSTKTLIVENERIRAEKGLRFARCSKDEFLMECVGGYDGTSLSDPSHFLTLNRVSGELAIKIYTNNASGKLVRYAHETGICNKARQKLF